MAEPFVRLFGDKEAAVTHVRAAKQLLAKVKEYRAQTGSPVFQLHRETADAVLKALSIGGIDVITVIATAPHGPALGRLGVEKLLHSGILFYHEAVRSETLYRQVVACPTIVKRTPDGVELTGIEAGQYANSAWFGPGAENGAKFKIGGAPTLIDERKLFMDPEDPLKPNGIFTISAQTYNERYDVHVCIADATVFVGGVPVVTGGGSCTIIGARMYDEVLAIAILRNSNSLLVRYLPLDGLTYEATTEDDLHLDANPLNPRLSVPFMATAGTPQGIFDFDPTEKERGAYALALSVITIAPNTALTYKKTVQWEHGRYIFDVGASDPADHFVQDGAGSGTVREDRTFHRGQTSTYTYTAQHPHSWPGLAVGGDLSEEISPPLDGERSSLPYPEGLHWALPSYWVLELLAAQSSYYNFSNYVVETSLPPVEYTIPVTQTTNFLLDRAFSYSIECLGFPSWIGYAPDGTLYRRLNDGRATHTVTGGWGIVSESTGEYYYKQQGMYITERLNWTTSNQHLKENEELTCVETNVLYKFDGESWVEEDRLVINERSYIRTGLDRTNTDKRNSLAAPHGRHAIVIRKDPVIVDVYDFSVSSVSATATHWYFGTQTPHPNVFTTRTIWAGTQAAYGGTKYGVPSAVHTTTTNGFDRIYSTRGGVVHSAEGTASPHNGFIVVPPVLRDRPWMVPGQPYEYNGGAGIIVGTTPNVDLEVGVSMLIGPLMPDHVEYEFPRVISSSLSFDEMFVSNRLNRGCVPLTAAQGHVVSPYAVYVSDLSAAVTAPTKAAFLVGSAVTDITQKVNFARKDPSTSSTAVRPNVTDDIFTSDFIAPRGLF